MEFKTTELKEMIRGKIDLSLIDELIGKNVFIRTVTHHYTGRAVKRDSMFLKLEKAAWIADDGRFNKAMEDSSNFVEVEPYPKDKPRYIGLYSILDIGELSGELPTKVI